MQVKTLLLSLCAAATAAAAGKAILQFEIDADTFTSDTPIAVPGTLRVNDQLIGATVATVSGVGSASCQAFNGNAKVAEPFSLNHFTTFAGGKKVKISKITCK